MNTIAEKINDSISDPAVRFVFPSEVTASFWVRETLRVTGKTAVRSDRFLSWDTFKEQYLSIKKQRRPSNRTVRSLFASKLLSKNRDAAEAGKPLLKGIIRPEFAENSSSFLRFVTGILPTLHLIEDIDPPEEQRDYLQVILQDLQMILVQYKTFLDESGRFEPNYEAAEIPAELPPVFLFFPDIIDDFPVYRELLKNRSDVVYVSLSDSPEYMPASRGQVGTDRGEGPANRSDPDAESGAEPAIQRAMKAPVESGGPGLSDDSSSTSQTPLLLFDSCLDEIRFVLNRIEHHLSSGVHPEDIAVTVADASYIDLFRREAVLRDIPLSFREGKPLSEYHPGRLFSMIQECIETGFSFDALQRLLLHRGLPWKKGTEGPDLVAFGREYFCTRTVAWKGEVVNPWVEHLTRTGRKRLLGFYKTLTGVMSGIVRSHDFSDLRKNVNTFVHHFFDNNLWDRSGLKVFQRCFTLIDDLEEAAESFSDLSGVSPFQLFLNTVNDRLYVDIAPGGVPVYPYRVAAGICSNHHMLLGASQEAVQITVSRYPFFREDQKQQLGLQDDDLTAWFLQVYSRSGKEMVVTCSKESPTGRVLAPGYFISNGAVTRGPSRSDFPDGHQDLYDREAILWAEGGDTAGRPAPAAKAVDEPEISEQASAKAVDEPEIPQQAASREDRGRVSDLPHCAPQQASAGPHRAQLPGLPPNAESPTGVHHAPVLNHPHQAQIPHRLHRAQKQGLDYARETAFTKKRDDVTRVSIHDPELRDALRSAQINERGRLPVTTGRIEQYQWCGFGYLLSYVLGIEETEYEFDNFDGRIAGLFTHGVLRRVYEKIKETDGCFDAARLHSYTAMAGEVMQEAERDWKKREPVFFLPVWQGFIDNCEGQVKRQLSVEGAVFPGFTITATEQQFSHVSGDCELRGRVDRVSEGEDGLALIDYKSRRSQSRSWYIGKDETLPSSYQLPLYVYLLERQPTEHEASPKVHSCSLYDLREGKYDHLYRENDKKAWVATREEIDALIATMLDQVRLLEEGVHRGDYRVWAEDCTGCAFRTVCRAKYTLD